MYRVRFYANPEDPRPVNWPVKHPYWVSGETGDGQYSIVISYADGPEYIHENWPEAKGLDMHEVEGYMFTDRFPKPEWFQEGEGGITMRALDETWGCPNCDAVFPIFVLSCPCGYPRPSRQ